MHQIDQDFLSGVAFDDCLDARRQKESPRVVNPEAVSVLGSNEINRRSQPREFEYRDLITSCHDLIIAAKTLQIN